MAAPASVTSPVVAVVMGVAGSGKTTVGRLLAETLSWPFADADDFHSAENVAKMAAGTALTDDDRWPWLDRVRAWIDARLAQGECGVVACSALKRAYRDRLRRPSVRFVYLEGDRALVERHLARRQRHFFRASLLESQFAVLEPPAPDEQAIAVALRDDATPAVLVTEIAARLARADDRAAAS